MFSPKNLAKIMAFFAQTTAIFCKNLITTLVFEKTPICFAENWKKLPKILIITSTPVPEQSFVLRTGLNNIVITRGKFFFTRQKICS
jgi:hypothetical protein